MKWIGSIIVAALVGLGLSVPAAQAQERVLIGSESIDGSSFLWFETSEASWTESFELRHEGDAPVSGDVTIRCGFSTVRTVPLTLDNETREISGVADQRNCELDIDLDGDNFDDSHAIDAYALLGTPQLDRNAADRFAEEGLTQRMGRAWTAADGKNVSCDRETHDNRRVCQMTFGHGSVVFYGLMAVTLDRIPDTADQAAHTERMRIRRVNWDCVWRVRGAAARQQCVHVVRGQAGGPVVD